MKLTVIFRDDFPLLTAGDSPRYRSVQIELTDEQLEKIKRRVAGLANGKEVYENYSKCFLEE